MSGSEDVPVNRMQSSTTSSSASSTETIRKGLLWQMKDGGSIFSRWKERYFILTQDYLSCFKKSTKRSVGGLGSFLASEMGSFAYKLKLVEIDSIEWKSCSDCSTRSLRRRRKNKQKVKTKNKRNSTICKLTSSVPMMKKSFSEPNHGDTDTDGGGSDGEIRNSSSQYNNHHNQQHQHQQQLQPNHQSPRHNIYLSSTNDGSESETASSSSKGPRSSGVKQVVSITISNTGAHIDLWTSSRSTLDEWFSRLKEACHNSKERREALMKKSQILSIPSPSHEPFALSVASNSLYIMSSEDCKMAKMKGDEKEFSKIHDSLLILNNSRPNSRLDFDQQHLNHHQFLSSSSAASSKRHVIETTGRNSATLIREPLLGPRLAPQTRGISSSISSSSGMSSLVSLDRRLMGKRNFLSSGGLHAASIGISVPTASSSLFSSSSCNTSSSSGGSGLERRTLIRNATAVAAANGSVQPVSSILIQNQFNLHESSCPRSLQVSPALPQRSLYAQHIFNSSQHQHNSDNNHNNGLVSSPLFCTASRGWTKDDLLRFKQSNMRGHNNSSDVRNNSRLGFSIGKNGNNSSSVMKSATSEFSFVRSDSPSLTTLPNYNKSKSFYGRHPLPPPPPFPDYSLDDPPPPVRPPLPRESSTLTRITTSSSYLTENRRIQRILESGSDVTYSRQSHHQRIQQNHHQQHHQQHLPYPPSHELSSSGHVTSGVVRPSSYHYGFREKKGNLRSESPKLEDLVEKIKFDDCSIGTDDAEDQVVFRGSNSNLSSKSIGANARKSSRMNRILEKTSLQFSH